MWHFRYSGQVLRDSRFGKIAAFQQALSGALGQHGQAGITVDGGYGRRTRDAVVRICDLSEFAELRVPETDPHFGAISTSIWDRLMPIGSAPTVHERAFVISLSHEGTDYDKAEWNLGTSDHASVLTWGPYGATVGHGGEVQAILGRVRQRDGQLLQHVFGAEFPTLERLLDHEPGETVLAPVHENAPRRHQWLQILATLGAEPLVRAEYEAYAFTTNDWLRPPIRRLYQGLIPAAPHAATAVDYGFFLDLAMHMSISQARVATAREAVTHREQELARPLTSSERRQVISRTMIPSAQQVDRLGRNVVFYVDGLGEEALSGEERTAWRNRTGRRASDCGLNDEERFFPDFLG